VDRAHELRPEALGDHLDRLFRAAWAMCGRREDAEDLVQETYARVLAKPRLVPNTDDLGYLLRVLRTTHNSRLRTAARRPSTMPFPDDLEPADPRTAWRPEQAIDTDALFAAIATLPEPFRDALVAVDVAGLSYREAGRLLHAREATITTRLHRARRQVAATLAGEEPRRAGKEATR
jgi:RNA polymerase sigma-70 factor (ECF subfamily)